MSLPPLDELLELCRRREGLAVVEAQALSAEEAERLASSLAGHNIQARVIDLAHVSGKAALLRELARAFNFPGYFGHNWDALIDSWSDLSWLPAAGYVAILLNADAFRAAHPRIHDAFLTVCDDVARRWAEDDKVVFKVVRAAAG
jgi:RNAse (barnase) inhibitor barstar